MMEERIAYRSNGEEYVAIHVLLDVDEAGLRQHLYAVVLRREEFSESKCRLLEEGIRNRGGDGVFNMGSKSSDQFRLDVQTRRDQLRLAGQLIEP
jgi:hypothetical protein